MPRTPVAPDSSLKIVRSISIVSAVVIAALLPMAFVSGLMGPYMSPIPINASMGMLLSLAIAFIVSPWAAMRLFRKEAHLPETDSSAPRRAGSARGSPGPEPEPGS